MPEPPSSILRAIPFVTNESRVFLEVWLSSRIEYPTKDEFVPTAPGGSPSSRETRWAREIADIRRGSVTTILQCFPLERQSSSMKLGSCVDFPLVFSNQRFVF